MLNFIDTLVSVGLFQVIDNDQPNSISPCIGNYLPR